MKCINNKRNLENECAHLTIISDKLIRKDKG